MRTAIVIGAGASGLAAAWELKRGGADVLVIDSAEQPGGVICGHERDGFCVEEGPSVALDLPLAMTIPKDYIADENLRMEIYRKLATAELPRQELLEELTDRFGRPPKSVLALLDLVDLKRAAEALRVQAISATGGQLIFRLRRDARIDVDRLIRYVSTRAGAAFSPTGVLSLELPAGQSVIDAARAVLAELAA